MSGSSTTGKESVEHRLVRYLELKVALLQRSLAGYPEARGLIDEYITVADREELCGWPEECLELAARDIESHLRAVIVRIDCNNPLRDDCETISLLGARCCPWCWRYHTLADYSDVHLETLCRYCQYGVRHGICNGRVAPDSAWHRLCRCATERSSLRKDRHGIRRRDYEDLLAVVRARP